MIPLELAKIFWKSPVGRSNLKGWDLISPNRASNNIGEFSILVPGEERIVLTKEVFVLRAMKAESPFDPFYLLWALSLKAVRMQWLRVTFMQTNREDVGERFKEIRIPAPKDKAWAKLVSKNFREYFTALADAKSEFLASIHSDSFDYIASINTVIPSDVK
jgi:type I restriction enzyme M protein